MKTRDYFLKPPASAQEADFIPMHHKQGDVFLHEKFGRLRVVLSAPKAPRCLCESLDGRRGFEYEFSSGKVTELEDRHRCADCGKFACECRHSTTHNTQHTMSDKNIVTVAEMASYRDDFPIERINGIITKLYDPEYKTKAGKALPYPKQNGTFRDLNGDEHPITFANEKVFQDKSITGQEIDIQCYSGQRGMSGIKMKVEEWQGKTYRKIWVTGTAQITLGAGQAEAQPAPPKAQEAPPAAKPSGRPPASEDNEPFEDRVESWFRGFDIVCEAAGKSPADMRASLSATDLKEITTGTIMSFKAAYGMHQRPHFHADAAQPASPVAEDDPRPQGEVPAESSWRSFVHPKRGKTLGAIHDEDEADFLKMVAWSFSADTEGDKAATAFKANITLAAAELGYTPKEVFGLLMNCHPKRGGFFGPHLERAILESDESQAESGSDDQYIWLLDYVDEIGGLAAELSAKEAAEKAKPAKPSRGGKKAAQIPD